MQVLISGASVAGPVLAFWLSRYGYDVTVVERAPELRMAGGHAVDLFRPAVEVSEKMGVLAQIEARTAGMTGMRLQRVGGREKVDIDNAKLLAATSDRHVEIMRDDLSEIYFKAGRDSVKYIFDDEVVALSDDGEVTFAHGRQHRFDIIVGADGLHSRIRQLVFGPEESLSTFLGGYLAVMSTSKDFADPKTAIGRIDARRSAMVYTASHLDDARVLFLMRPAAQLQYHHRDIDLQKRLLREQFSDMGSPVDGWLDELDSAQTFYFDSITQLQMNTWSRGRVTLVGDAGYCPGPAVGGGTSLAVVGAYILAGELAAANGDHQQAFAMYEQKMRQPVMESRAFASRVAQRLVPTTGFGVQGLLAAGWLLSHTPTGLIRAVRKSRGGVLRTHDSTPVPDYPSVVK